MATKQYGMVIDLHNCVGCAGCDIACKAENNLPHGFAWSNHALETSGTFPNVQFRYIPTLCNHCENAPCVANCPTTAAAALARCLAHMARSTSTKMILYRPSTVRHRRR